MSFVDNGGTNGFYMPVSPAYGAGGNGFGNGFGNDGAWWLLVLLFALGGYGNRFGNGNDGGNSMIPYMLSNGNASGELQRGFDQQAVMSGINSLTSDVCNGFANTQQSICNSTSNLSSAINNGFASAEIANNSRQMADMNQNFNMQTAIAGGINSLQSQLAQCCCDNRLATANLNSTILSENCADRAALSDGIRNILENQTSNTQRLVDTTNNAINNVMSKICQLELDAKNDKIADLQSKLTLANLASSQNNQTSVIQSGQRALASEIEQVVRPTAVPAYIVSNPNGVSATCGCTSAYSTCGY